jgi:hypothetical protein
MFAYIKKIPKDKQKQDQYHAMYASVEFDDR